MVHAGERKQYPGSFKVDFVGKLHERVFYYRITRYPICAYCQKPGVGADAPVLRIEQCGHGVLHRQQTIASGGDYCDYFIAGDREKQAEVEGMEIQTTQKARKWLLIGLLGAILTLIGDLLIGYVKFPEGTGMLEGYFAAALALPVWRAILGGMIGFLGISLEFLGLMTLYPLLKKNIPRGAAFYKLSMYVYLAIAGGAVHLPCGVFMWLYHSVADTAGQAVGYDIALQYVLYFILPVSVVFYVFFAGSSIVQFVGIIKGNTPLPKWYAVFNLLIVSVLFNALRKIGNYPIVNGIGTSNKSLSAIVMFIALYIGFGKYVRQEDLL